MFGAVDTGLYVGTLLLAAHSAGVATVPQAALAMHAPLLREYLAIPEAREVLLGISFGYPTSTPGRTATLRVRAAR